MNIELNRFHVQGLTRFILRHRELGKGKQQNADWVAAILLWELSRIFHCRFPAARQLKRDVISQLAQIVIEKLLLKYKIVENLLPL